MEILTAQGVRTRNYEMMQGLSNSIPFSFSGSGGMKKSGKK
jgi:hypothetical protein